MTAAAESDVPLLCGTCGAVFRTAFALCPQDGGKLAPLVTDPLIGKPFADRYVIDGFLGQGGMGRVYRARHNRVSRRFALKILFGELAADPRMRARFAREAEAASRMDHPNVVSVVDFGETPQKLLYLAMTYVEGQDLANVLDAEAPLPWPRVVGLSMGLLRGLAHAHGVGLVHRDFKPANVIVVRDGAAEVPKIVDFGLAVMPEKDLGAGRLTTGRFILGTPEYMSPEQAFDEPVDGRADLYSLGITMFEMLTGHMPFEDADRQLVMRRNAYEKAPALSVVAPEIQLPAALEQLVMRLIEKKASDRFADANEALAALEEIAPVPQRLGSVRPSAGTSPSPSPSTSPSAEPNLSLPASMVALPAVPVTPAVTTHVDPISGESEPVAPAGGRRKPLMLVAGVVGLVAVAAILTFALRGKKQQRPASTPLPSVADHTPPSPSVSPLAPATAAPTPSPTVEPSPTPVVSPSPTASASPRPSASASPRPTPSATATPAPSPGVITTTQLKARYQATGATLDKLVRAGHPQAAALRKRYFDIPFATALRTESMRPDVMEQLRRLDRDLAAAQK